VQIKGQLVRSVLFPFLNHIFAPAEILNFRTAEILRKCGGNTAEIQNFRGAEIWRK
jgi:hypothetical protein